MRGVDLEQLESGVDRAARGRGEVVDDRVDAGEVERDRLGEAVERDRGGRDGRPAALGGGHGAVGGPRTATTSRPCGRRGRAGCRRARRGRGSPRRSAPTRPAARRSRCRCLRARCGPRARPRSPRRSRSPRRRDANCGEVRVVPLLRHAVDGAVLAHRRDPQAVAGGQPADRRGGRTRIGSCADRVLQRGRVAPWPARGRPRTPRASCGGQPPPTTSIPEACSGSEPGRTEYPGRRGARRRGGVAHRPRHGPLPRAAAPTDLVLAAPPRDGDRRRAACRRG